MHYPPHYDTLRQLHRERLHEAELLRLAAAARRSPNSGRPGWASALARSWSGRWSNRRRPETAPARPMSLAPRQR